MSIAATDERDRGQPTSWSAAIDALAAGRSFDPSTHGLDDLDDGDDAARRLFVLCAGNIDATTLYVAHLDRSDTEPVHDPGQAWNALTVGAITDKALIDDPNWASWRPVARAEELSPWSTTGVTFADAWPIKPDVVFEGGNVAQNDKGEVTFPCPDLSLLSTYFKPAKKSFVLSWATSAATAQAARLAALISAEYASYCVAPIYRIHASMEALTAATLAAAFARLCGYMDTPRVPSPLRSAGIGIVLFARDEPNLYRALFLERHGVAEIVRDLLARLGAASTATPGLSEVERDKHDGLVLDLWLYTHGLASMASAGLVTGLDEAWVAEKLQRVGAVLIGAALANRELRPIALVADEKPRRRSKRKP